MLNRRTALAMAATTLPALAVPTAVAAMGSPDAELLELGVKLDAVISDWQAETRLYREETNVWEAACKAAGLPRLEMDEVPSEEEFHARHKARSELWYPEKAEYDARLAATHDEHGVSIVWNDIHGRLYPILGIRAALLRDLQSQSSEAR
jgi:hypothetical protein